MPEGNKETLKATCLISSRVTHSSANPSKPRYLGQRFEPRPAFFR